MRWFTMEITLKNCYGIKELNNLKINFCGCNKALIYAPNGVMKSSLAKVFEDISCGLKTTDRIFDNLKTSYFINFGLKNFTYDSQNATNIPKSANIYVVNSFTDTFEFTRESVATLLADEETRKQYDTIVNSFSTDIKTIEERLRELSGLTKNQIKQKIIEDLELSNANDWPDIIEKIKDLSATNMNYTFWGDCKYSILFSDKAISLYSNEKFKKVIVNYTDKLKQLLKNNPVLSETFTDNKAEQFTKDLQNSELFSAKHTIHLKDGKTIIRSFEDWDKAIKDQINLIYSDETLGKSFKEISSILSKNKDVLQVKDTLMRHREIIGLLSDIGKLKIQFWLFAFNSLPQEFDTYYQNIHQYSEQIRDLYDAASEQSEKWRKVVDEFNRRFKVPFKIRIENKANFLLKDEAPNFDFVYFRGLGETEESKKLCKQDLMVSLSTGEKRALYLLYILFEIERIKTEAEQNHQQYLIVIDDIADSFDYKNKYAIIEYLNDISNIEHLNLLILTHNFDFYRTVKLRLNVRRNNCLIAQRDQEGIITVTEFKYQKDFFKNAVIQNIADGQIVDDNKKKSLISSIPFYRNLCEYSGKGDDFKKLTCFLHFKSTPLETSSLKLSDLWGIIKQFLNNASWSGADENYWKVVERLANECVTSDSNEVFLENKLVVAIAIRLKAEIFLKEKIKDTGEDCSDSESNQTRDWFNRAKNYLTQDQIDVIDEVNLITPENIHLNAFMYEPLIDVSDWTLKDLYKKVSAL